MSALAKDSARHGTTGEDIDFALLVDGLEAEREQGITIDVAYRFFSTARRSFIVADTPGHEQFTRNMATGASKRRSRHHSHRCAQGRAGANPAAFADLLAARHSPCGPRGKQDRSRSAINKETFDRIVGDYTAFAVAARLYVPSCRFRFRPALATT